MSLLIQLTELSRKRNTQNTRTFSTRKAMKKRPKSESSVFFHFHFSLFDPSCPCWRGRRSESESDNSKKMRFFHFSLLSLFQFWFMVEFVPSYIIGVIYAEKNKNSKRITFSVFRSLFSAPMRSGLTKKIRDSTRIQ